MFSRPSSRAARRIYLATTTLALCGASAAACVGTTNNPENDDAGLGLGDDAAADVFFPVTVDGAADTSARDATDASVPEGSVVDSTPGPDATDAGGQTDATDAAGDANDAAGDASDGAPTPDAGFDATLPFPIALESPGAANAAPNGTTYLQGPSSPCISQDGHYVAFFSGATNLAGGTGATGGYRMFTRDTVAGTTTQVSLLPDGGDLYFPYGGATATVSGDGRYVVYVVLATSWDPTLPPSQAVFLRWDRTTGQSTLIGETADGGAYYSGSSPVLSSDGRYLAFYGAATLDPSGANAGTTQVWVRDFLAPGNGLTLASATDGPLDAGPDAGDAAVGVAVGANGYPTSIQTVTISSDATVVAFDAQVPNLSYGAQEAGVNTSNLHCYVRNLTTQTTQMVDVPMAGAATPFPDGECVNPQLSGNGRYVLFFSLSTNLVPGDTNATGDVFLRDLQLGTTTRLTTASDGSQIASLAVLNPDYGISNDGSIIVLGDRSHRMVAGDLSTDDRVVVVLDMTHGTRKLASYGSDGTPLAPPQDTWTPGVSSDGTFIVFGGSGSFFPTPPSSQEVIIGVATAAAR